MSRSRPEPDVRAVPAGDEVWVSIVEHVASTVSTPQALEEQLKRRYPNAVVSESWLEGLTRPIWYVYRRRWFIR